MKFQSKDEALEFYNNTCERIEANLPTRNKHLRIGQFWFLEMHNAFKDYDEYNFINHYIVGNNDLDPFYIDDNIKRFKQAIYTYFIINWK